MKVSIIIIIVAIKMMSLCSADLNFLSFITKIYDSNVKSFWNAFSAEKHRIENSMSLYDDHIYDSTIKIDENYWFYYPRKNHHYEVRQHTIRFIEILVKGSHI